MVKYSCSECGKNFNQKSHYDTHKNKKIPCVLKDKTLNNFIEIKVKDAMIEGKVYECKTCKEHKLTIEFENKSDKICFAFLSFTPTFVLKCLVTFSLKCLVHNVSSDVGKLSLIAFTKAFSSSEPITRLL